MLLPSALTWRVSTEEKAVFLTFDDGPDPGLTPRILDILDQYQARATFFCVGENVARYPEIYRQISLRGHATGNHTHRHLKGIKTSTTDYLDDIREAALHIDSRLFRPPYGLITPDQARKLTKHYSVIMWSALTRDFDPRITPEQCLVKATRGVSPGAIIVFHDNLKASEKVLFALPALLEYLKKEGWECRVLSSEF